MSEAFEIGVTLALSDGVSAGIERARREMAQLQEILDGGGLPVEKLRSVAAGPVAPTDVKSVQSKKVVEPPAPVSLVDNDAVGAAGRDRLLQPAISPVVGVITSPSAVQEQQWLAPSLSAPAHQTFGDVPAGNAKPTITATNTGQVAPTINNPKTDPAQPVSNQSIITNFNPSPEQNGSGFAAPSSEVRVQVDQGSQAPISQGALGVNAAWLPQAGKDMGAASAGLSIPRQAASQADRLVVAPVIASAPSARTSQSKLIDQTDQTAPTSVHGATYSPAPERKPNPLLEPERDAGKQIAGDVYLDGMLVGRWISRYLKQEAGRASAGPTGFDLRRDRILPGPTVGA